MMTSRLGRTLAPLLAAAVLACSSAPPSRPGQDPPDDQTGGSGGTGGTGGSGAGGRGGGGAAGAGGGGASGRDAGAAGRGGDGGAGGSGGAGMRDAAAAGDAPVTRDAGAPDTSSSSMDVGAPSATCDYTPKAAALGKKLRFERITLNGLPNVTDWTRNGNYGGGITEVKFVPGTTDEFFLTRKAGGIFHFKLSGNSATLISTLSLGDGQVSNREDCGLIALDFDPDYATNKLVYFGHCTGAGRSSKISRATHMGGQLTDRVDILTVQAPGEGNSWHSVGSMGFDKDKNLWLLHGEFNTGGGDPAQDPASPLGKVHRLVPSRRAGMGGATPAPGNPTPGSTIYARGLRSPWRGSYHPAKGWYIIGDVGPGSQQPEEVNVLTQAGQNFGWPTGTCNAGNVVCWRPAPYPGLADLNDQYEGRVGRTVWVSPVYGNCGNDRYQDALTGVVLVGDFFTGWVVGMLLDDAGKKSRDANLGATLTMISSFTQGPDGYLYATKFGRYHQGAEGENPADSGLYRAVLAP
jgi:hypothetical protein